MILLTSTSDKLQLVTSGAQQVWVHASYVDLNGTTITPGRKNTSVASATTTDIVGAPGSSTTRNIKSLIISNQDAATATTVTVQHTDGTTVPVLTKMVLQPGSTLVFSENMGWEVMDNQGGLGTSPATGRLLKINVFTGGTTFTSSSQTKSIRVRMVAGGGSDHAALVAALGALAASARGSVAVRAACSSALAPATLASEGISFRSRVAVTVRVAPQCRIAVRVSPRCAISVTVSRPCVVAVSCAPRCAVKVIV